VVDHFVLLVALQNQPDLQKRNIIQLSRQLQILLSQRPTRLQNGTGRLLQQLQTCLPQPLIPILINLILLRGIKLINQILQPLRLLGQPLHLLLHHKRLLHLIQYKRQLLTRKEITLYDPNSTDSADISYTYYTARFRGPFGWFCALTADTQQTTTCR
jgi:hypothetical protein